MASRGNARVLLTVLLLHLRLAEQRVLRRSSSADQWQSDRAVV